MAASTSNKGIQEELNPVGTTKQMVCDVCHVCDDAKASSASPACQSSKLTRKILHERFLTGQPRLNCVPTPCNKVHSAQSRIPAPTAR